MLAAKGNLSREVSDPGEVTQRSGFRGLAAEVGSLAWSKSCLEIRFFKYHNDTVDLSAYLLKYIIQIKQNKIGQISCLQ